MTSVHRDQRDGFEVYRLRSDAVELELVPELGAKLLSLKHVPSGRDWMWAPPGGARLLRSPTGAAFASGTKCGADECLPTIASCQWGGLSLPDHGDAWTEAWELDRRALDQPVLATRLRLPISPLVISRVISLEGCNIRISYTLQNTAPGPFEYIWAFHPLIAFRIGDRLRLPRAVRSVRCGFSVGGLRARCGDEWPWPRPMPGMDLESLDLGGNGRAVKCFTPPLAEGWAALENELTGEYLRFAWDVRDADTLGIWINRGGWGSYHHVALEPTNGAPDALDAAVREWRRFGVLRPGEIREWVMRVDLGVDLSCAARTGNS